MKILLFILFFIMIMSCSKTVITDNTAPTGQDLVIYTNENTAVAFNLIGNDKNKDKMYFEIVTSPANGSVVLLNQVALYTPNNSFAGNDDFQYRIFDGKKYSSNHIVNIIVNDTVLPNTPAVANNINPAALTEDVQSIITLNYTDVDVERANFCTILNLTNVVVSLACSCSSGICSVGITGTNNYNGAASFDYTVSTNGQTSNTATATLTINAVNDQPVILGTPLSIVTNLNVQAAGTFLATDVEGSGLTFSLVSGASNGTAIVNGDGTYTYQPNASFSGSDSFVIKVNDGTIDSANVTVNVVVNDNLVCPSQYVKIAANSSLGTSEFCIMKYEAKDSAGVATSAASGVPWINITPIDAKTECTDLGVGYDLISNREWMATSYLIENQSQNWSSSSVGTGVLVRGNTDGGEGILSVSNVNEPYNQTTNSTSSGWEQRRTFYISASEFIWDLSGNVWEWVDWTTGGVFDVGFNSCSTDAWSEFFDIPSLCSIPTPNLLDYSPNNPAVISPALYNAANYNLGRIYITSDTSFGAALRGGYYADNFNAGIYSLALDSATNGLAFNIGFRCVFR